MVRVATLLCLCVRKAVLLFLWLSLYALLVLEVVLFRPLLRVAINLFHLVREVIFLLFVREIVILLFLEEVVVLPRPLTFIRMHTSLPIHRGQYFTDFLTDLLNPFIYPLPILLPFTYGTLHFPLLSVPNVSPLPAITPAAACPRPWTPHCHAPGGPVNTVSEGA